MAPGAAFHYEIAEAQDESGWQITTITCHGKLVSENTAELRSVVNPLIQRGGRIVLDLGELEYMDSSGLGTLVGLKVSAINRGLVVLELKNLTPRIKQLLSITNLSQLFSS
jgi:anti-sigma B factor antagonist